MTPSSVPPAPLPAGETPGQITLLAQTPEDIPQNLAAPLAQADDDGEAVFFADSETDEETDEVPRHTHDTSIVQDTNLWKSAKKLAGLLELSTKELSALIKSAEFTTIFGELNEKCLEPARLKAKVEGTTRPRMMDVKTVEQASIAREAGGAQIYSNPGPGAIEGWNATDHQHDFYTGCGSSIMTGVVGS